MMVMATAMTVTAQSQRADTVNQRVFDAKVREMVYHLNITEEQKPKFVDIYREYTQEMIAAWGEHQRPAKPETTDEAVALQKRRLERQQRAQAIRLRYIDEFATVLTPTQLNRFFEVENKIQKKLKARHNRVHGRAARSVHGRAARR